MSDLDKYDLKPCDMVKVADHGWVTYLGRSGNFIHILESGSFEVTKILAALRPSIILADENYDAILKDLRAPDWFESGDAHAKVTIEFTEVKPNE